MLTKRQQTDSQDIDYIKKYYTIEFDESQAVTTVGGRDDSARYAKGEKEFQPMYMIKQVPADPKLLVSIPCHTIAYCLYSQEMCFDCSAFQYQLDKTKPYKDHIFQTIFLNNKDEHTWQKDEIKKECISKSN